MNKEPANTSLRHLDACLAFCEGHSLTRVVIGIPIPVSSGELKQLLAKEGIAGVVVQPAGDAMSEADNPEVGFFIPDEYRWELPQSCPGAVVYLGPRNQISFRMVRHAIQRGVHWLVYGVPGFWHKEHVFLFVLRRCVERALWSGNRCLNHCMNKDSRLFRMMIKPVLLPIFKLLAPVGRYLVGWRTEIRLERFASLWGKGLFEQEAFVSGRVVLVNSALAWGGAERQVVNTLHGLRDHGVGDLALLCEHLDLSADHRFFEEQMSDIRLDCLETWYSPEDMGLSDEQVEQLRSGIKLLPREIGEDVMRYAMDFIKRRPAIVHVWQDTTSIKAGLAALMVGVPCIVLSGRNVAPIHFTYYKYYMRSVYRTLAGMDRVKMTNNSTAGAADYAAWLGLPSKCIRVLHNGMAERFIRRAPQKEANAYRRLHSIPENVPLIGAIFRFYEEKDPLLWVRTAAEVAKVKPDAWFLLIGTGPMENDIRSLAESLGIGDRLLLPGTDKNPAVPLSAMDVFLLTSRFEGTPNVLIEAQWIGLPVVATDAGGSSDTFIDGTTGWLVRRRDPRLLAEHIIKVIDDKEWGTKAREEAQTMVHGRFDLDRMISEIMKVYEINV